MNNPIETRNKILSLLRIKGPSLPVQIARETAISPLFAGAFLSELAKDDAIKISKMKVGGSPLYYLKGQEDKLDNFYKYLPDRERDAFLMLKENKILEDKKQEPAIRVALRSIKDFAFPFLKDQEVLWRFHTVTEQEVRQMLEPKKITPPKLPVKQEVKQVFKQEIKQTTPKPEKNKEKQLDIGLKQKKSKPAEKFSNPLVIKEKPEKKPYSEFVTRVIEKINNKYNFIEEKYYKPKDYSCIVQIKSELGPINFLVFAKDKKKISETDLKNMLSEAQKIPLPALILYKGELSKKALELSVRYFSILKLERL